MKNSIQLNKISEMTKDERRDLRIKMFKEFHNFLNVFNRKAAEVLSLNWIYDYKIEINSDRSLFKSQLYSMSQFKLKKMKKYLKKNLWKDFIILSNIFYISPILFTQKFNDDLWFCVDYWKLNVFMKKNWYLLLLIDETLTWMSDCKFIIKFNIIAVFNKLCINSESKNLTTFITSIRLYKYCVMSFDLMNKLALYQHYINNTLLLYLNNFV